MDEAYRLELSDQMYTANSWLVLEYRANPSIRLNAVLLDRILADDDELVLAVNDYVIVVLVHNPSLATKLAEELSPYTRSSPITRPEAYLDARRRLDVLEGSRESSRFAYLMFGDDEAHVRHNALCIGDTVIRNQDIARYATVGAALPVGEGFLWAPIAMLLIADHLRLPESREYLSRRLRSYESDNEPSR